jgi:hypothetical protein
MSLSMKFWSKIEYSACILSIPLKRQ